MDTLSKNKIKLIRSLRQKKHRDQEGLFLVEGRKSVLEACSEYPELIEFICTSDENHSADYPTYLADHTLLESISGLKTATGFLGVFKKPSFNDNLQGPVLALDGVQDPGNLGTIVRTADWFGIKKIICSKDTVDVYNEKTVQATMGSIFRTNVEYVDLVDYLNSTDKPVYGALMEGSNLFETKLYQHGVYVLGNEGNGIRPETIACITDPIHIPGNGGAESLNVGIAAGIIMAELFRTA